VASRKRKGEGRAVKRERRARHASSRERLYEPSRPEKPEQPFEALTPLEHYLRERARRAQRQRGQDHPLEEARRAYEALLAQEAESRKGGRPRKMVTQKARLAPSDEAGESDEG
jgi:hypothetical protein